MNKKQLKKCVAMLQYETVFDYLDTKDYDTSRLRDMNQSLIKLANHCIKTKRKYTADEWELQKDRNTTIAKYLLKYIDQSHE